MESVLCIIAIVERGKADKIVEKAKDVGAKGATILYGRGTGESEVKKFLNIHIEASKEVILVLSEESKYRPIFDSIVEAGKLKEPGTGIIFTLPVSNLVGLHHREEV
ncbi:P-II family nitrogen regulator [Anaerosalibacter sp. Marseille-P3206]|uniref:P-II family nitrogen regulator n=1 Tax=Anaerosalibacter sp. Marseille-P3206 TaxID=1871005 RepID=UPI0009842E0D|nr:P-II family nitrogen regulator [Anaerosalibacter sp. Marseille-P3206]